MDGQAPAHPEGELRWAVSIEIGNDKQDLAVVLCTHLEGAVTATDSQAAAGDEIPEAVAIQVGGGQLFDTSRGDAKIPLDAEVATPVPSEDDDCPSEPGERR